jgi:D-3-phosphoglycerate dehydrogenase
VLDALGETEFRNAVNMPLAEPEVLRTLRPFLDLAEKVGSLQTQLADGRITKIEVEFQGDLSAHVKLLTVAILRGLLTPILSESVNYINAPHLANRRGIAVAQTTGFDTPNYANLISCRAIWKDGSRLIAATIFHTNEPRIVQVDHYRLDLRPEGRILVVNSIDVPGVIGKMGTILGEAQVNIASMRLGRTEPGGQVLTFLKVDNEVPSEAITRLEATEPIERVRQVIL